MGEFSDDDLDGLEEDDLLALEEDSSTAPTQILSHPYHHYISEKNVNGLDGHQQYNVQQTDFGATASQGQQNGVPSISRQGFTVTNSNQHGPITKTFPNREPGPSTQREQWRQSRYASTTPGLQRASTVGNVNLPHRETGLNQPAVQKKDDPKTGKDNEAALELAKLRAEVETMRKEQERLRQAAKAANDQMLAKSGEISILRANQTKTQQDFEKRIDDLQKRHMLEAERHQAEIDQSRKERERLASHNQFLNHERNDENWHLKQNQRSAVRDKENKRPLGDTPKKTKPSHFGDGFDDDEVMFISPTKSAGKSRTTTPRGGLKRKRDALADSPMKQLELSPSIEYLPETDSMLQPILAVDPNLTSSKQNHNFKFFQHLLTRQISKDEQRTYEILSRHWFPTEPQKSLSSILTDNTASLSLSFGEEDFPSAITQIILSIWSRCLDETYYKPIRHLMDLVEFALMEGSTTLIANVVDQVVDLTQRTADINIIPRYKRFRRKLSPDEPDNRPLNLEIDTRACLELLDLTLTLGERDHDIVKRFWKSMRFDFISMLLRNSQDVGDVTLMAKILSQSVRNDTFAMIVAPPASQSVSEQHVVDRLSSMLIEMPRVLEGENQPDILDTCNMRLEILNLIDVMTTKRYCGEAFAKHPSALGRLVRVMHDELNCLYEYKYGHEKRAELVNQSTRLLYHINRGYAEAIGNFQEKLRAPPTSVYKYLIGFSRLAFSEGIVFEQDIGEDVIEIAYEMLELFTTPEETEAIQKAFVKDGSRNATAPMTG